MIVLVTLAGLQGVFVTYTAVTGGATEVPVTSIDARDRGREFERG